LAAIYVPNAKDRELSVAVAMKLAHAVPSFGREARLIYGLNFIAIHNRNQESLACRIVGRGSRQDDEDRICQQ
jgi:hypothetical protein